MMLLALTAAYRMVETIDRAWEKRHGMRAHSEPWSFHAIGVGELLSIGAMPQELSPGNMPLPDVVMVPRFGGEDEPCGRCG